MDTTITPLQMKALETEYMTRTGVPAALLMEHAAQGVCAALAELIPGGKAVFLCGTGNNGGDGYAAARLWQAQGGQAEILEMTDAPVGDALMNRTLALQYGIPVTCVTQAPDALPDCDAVVDALFGTGLSRPVTGVAAELIRLANKSGKPVVAVDIPSGLDGETGRVLGVAVRAAVTVTFHRMKPGLLLRQGAVHAGQIRVQPILIPPTEGPQDGLRCLQPDDLPALIPPRPRDGHKGTFGKAVIFAGSVGMAGAAAFCANACIKAGAGLTTVLCVEDILPIVQTLAPGATCVPLRCMDTALIRRTLQGASAAAIGCGLGQADELKAVLPLFAQADCPVVWDADALNLLAADPSLAPLPATALLTPHPGEAARLLGWSVAQVTQAPLEALRVLQARYGGTVLLKSARTLMTDGLHTACNLHGTPALGKGGSGDVLAGILTALLASHPRRDLLTVAQLGAMLHGMAALRAEQLCGENCLTPQLLIDHIRLD